MYELETLDRYDQPALVTLRGLDRISAIIKRKIGEYGGEPEYDYCVLIGVEFFKLSEEEYNKLYETFKPENP